ncbi:MAG: long-chain fatty acid--CoA ligase [Deltaproteobacteria bacterium]|nr:MAG: long-chain fatty acid--CoA ligase [Deltaproteobacteria bacterium]
MNLGYLFSNAANKYPNRLAIISAEGNWTFKVFDQRTSRLAGAMLNAGLKKGDRVAILFFNSSYFVEVYFACLKAGLVATPVNYRFAGPEIVYVLNDAQPSILFYGVEFETTLQEIRQELETIRILVSPHDGDSSLALNYEEFLANGKRVGPTADVAEEDQCQIMYTSGTTGRPKGAVLTHRNLLWNLYNTILGREDKTGERALIVGPLYHTAALNNHFTIQVALAGTSIIVQKFEPESLLRTIEMEKATIISGAPALYNRLLQHPRAGEYDTSSITKCTVGSDKLPTEIKKRIFNFFPNINGIYEIYGCTEASPSIAILGAEDSLHKDGSVGKSAAFLEARIVDEDASSLPPGEVGELICRGPNVMQGYHRNPEGTKEALRDGWLHTGDLATMDKEGFFYIVDRKKDMIVSGGENIYPRELEEVLMGHPAIADVAVVGIPDPDWGEAVKAFVVLKEGLTINAQELIRFCKKHLASYKKPKAIAFVPSIPRNPSGKALKRILKEKYDH